MRARLALLLALLLVAAGAGARPTVIVVSLDGVRHDFLERAGFPALSRMQREGVRAEGLIPVYPSNTFPAHVSLATGTYPDVHGIVDNRFFDRARGFYDKESDASWIQAEPLWVAVERQGLPAAVLFWVGSETAWKGVGTRYRVVPFDGSMKEAAKVDQMLAWLDLPPAQRPSLIMSWWHGTDAVAHRKGPDHPDVVDALAAQDRQLGRLQSGLDARKAWAETTLLVVSDHGMTTVDRSVPVRERLDAAGVSARLVLGTAVAHVFLDDTADLPRAEAALRGLEGTIVTRGEALPHGLRLRHPTRTGDLVLRTAPPRTFRELGLARRVARAVMEGSVGWQLGLHGYSPDHPDMAGIFLALGRQVPAGQRLGRVRMIDVAPTVAALLGIEPPRQSEGSPIAALAPPDGAAP